MISSLYEQQIISKEKIDVQVNYSRTNQRSLIANVASQSADSHFGKVNITAKIEIEQLKNDYKNSKQKESQVLSQQTSGVSKKQKQRQIQMLKMQIESSHKKNKTFSLSLPINKTSKKSADSKIHFLLQITQKKALLTVVDDYGECKMNIKGNHQLELIEAVQMQKRKMDRRRKNSYDQQPVRHNDPDMQGGEQDQDD